MRKLFKLRPSTEREMDMVGLMQGYFGVLYVTGSIMIAQNNGSLLKGLTWGLLS